MHSPIPALFLRPAAFSLCFLAWAPSAAAPQQSRHTLGLPGSGWGVSLELPGFELSREQIRSDGGGTMIEAINQESGMMISLFVEREPEQKGTEACRDLYWERMRRSPLPMRNVRTTEQPPLSVKQYLVPSFQGQRLVQQNANAYYGRDGVCVDLHLSKVRYVPADSALFQAILRSVRIEDVEASAAGAGKAVEGGEPPHTAEAMLRVKVEPREDRGVRFSHGRLTFACGDPPGRERVEPWLRPSGDERRVSAVRDTLPSAGRMIAIGSAARDTI